MTRAVLAAIAGVLLAVAFLFMRAPGEPGVFMRDFEVYYSAGKAVAAHSDPYSPALLQFERTVPGVSRSKDELLPYVGAPPVLALWSAFSRLDYAASTRVWSVVLALSLASILYCTLRLCNAAATRSAFAALFCALAFVPITSDFGLGQAALVAYAAAAAAVLSVRRSVIGTALAVVAGALQPNVAASAIVCAWERRGLLALFAAAAVLYVAGALFAGFGWPAEYFALLRAHGAAERFDAIQYTPAAIAFGFGAGRDAANVFGAAVAVGAIGLAVFALRRSRTIAQRFAIACAALPLAAGFMHEHDLVLLFIPALWALRYAGDRARPFALAAFGLASINWMDFAQQPLAAPQDVVLAVAATLAALAWCERRTAALYASAAICIACAGAGAWIGVHHPAPIWPNDMSSFTVPPHASAAAIWHAEQLATGLEKVEPAWALLRSFALAGSIITFVVVSQVQLNAAEC